MLNLLAAVALFLAFVGGVIAQYAYQNWKVRRCSACRIEWAQNGRRAGHRSVILAHTCSPRRWPHKAPDAPPPPPRPVVVRSRPRGLVSHG